jgi:predicted RNA binding protein YcfA (HicA-like mRNA interferase family)
MKSFSSREIMKLLKERGCKKVAVRGSHHQFKHDTISGRVTLPHPKKDLPWPTVRSILKQAGLTEKRFAIE